MMKTLAAAALLCLTLSPLASARQKHKIPASHKTHFKPHPAVKHKVQKH